MKKKIAILISLMMVLTFALAACGGGGSEDPCQLFRSIAFPTGEFFPPNSIRRPENYEETKRFCGCR